MMTLASENYQAITALLLYELNEKISQFGLVLVSESRDCFTVAAKVNASGRMIYMPLPDMQNLSFTQALVKVSEQLAAIGVNVFHGVVENVN